LGSLHIALVHTDSAKRTTDTEIHNSKRRQSKHPFFPHASTIIVYFSLSVVLSALVEAVRDGMRTVGLENVEPPKRFSLTRIKPHPLDWRNSVKKWNLFAMRRVLMMASHKAPVSKSQLMFHR